MQTLNPKLSIIRTLLTKVLDDIDSGNCNNCDYELDAAIDGLTKLNRGIPRISKVEACERILHCSTRTFDNYLALGIIPKGRKVAHFKELSWCEKDFDKAKEYRRLNNDDK